MTTVELLSYASSACGVAASGAMLLDIRAILRDRKAQGVSLLSSGFFIAWGAINSAIFGLSGLLFPAVANGVFVALRCVWLGLAVMFARREVRPVAAEAGWMNVREEQGL